jgi:uncharacterized membrane protein HdeD (DUF308 family)
VLGRAASRAERFHTARASGGLVIAFGVILLIIGFIAKVAILWTIGIILLVVGLVLMILGSMGRAVGGRRHYY